MALVSEPLNRLARVTRSLGIYMLVLGGVLFAALVAMYGDSADASTSAVAIVAFGIVFLVQGVPGVLAILLANRMHAARAWAFYATAGLAGIDIAMSCLSVLRDLASHGLSHPITTLIAAILMILPWLVLMAAFVNAMPEVRNLRRQQRRQREQTSKGEQMGPRAQGPLTMPPRPKVADRKEQAGTV